MSRDLQQIKGIYEFYSQMWQKLSDIETSIRILERKLETIQNATIAFEPEAKIHEITVRDILGKSKKELDQLKAEGRIKPINKKNYYNVKDVLRLKRLLSTESIKL